MMQFDVHIILKLSSLKAVAVSDSSVLFPNNSMAASLVSILNFTALPDTQIPCSFSFAVCAYHED